jgi:hypothetical protein
VRGWGSVSRRRASERPTASPAASGFDTLRLHASLENGSSTTHTPVRSLPRLGRTRPTASSTATRSSDSSGAESPALGVKQSCEVATLAALSARRAPVSARGGRKLPATAPVSRAAAPSPTGVSRARAWSAQVEVSWRYQRMGWRDSSEYAAALGTPERWRGSGFPACVKAKDTGAFVYFRKDRECPDKFVGTVKLYRYE